MRDGSEELKKKLGQRAFGERRRGAEQVPVGAAD
jgi:hypothetical protein